MKTDLAPIFNAKAAELGAEAIENGLNEISNIVFAKLCELCPSEWLQPGGRGTLRTLRLIDVECKK